MVKKKTMILGVKLIFLSVLPIYPTEPEFSLEHDSISIHTIHIHPSIHSELNPAIVYCL